MSSTKCSSSENNAEDTTGEESRTVRHFSHQVAPEQAGLRLDKVLSGMPEVPSREYARRLILQRRVKLAGVTVDPDTRVKGGELLEYFIPPPAPTWLQPDEGELDILHEDSSLLVINKPPGMPMHPGVGHKRFTLVNYLLHHCHDLSGISGTLRPGIVHRLDKDTSGLVVVAKNDETHLDLQKQFKARTINRTYVALAVGRPRVDKGMIDLPLGRQRTRRIHRAVDPRGKHARTHWWVLERLGPFTYLRLKLETGRTHQIRVHLTHEDWPLLGDPLYGKNRHRGLDLPPAVLDVLEGFKRQALHATELGFRHPATGEEMNFQVPPPPDLAAVLDFLRAWPWETGRRSR
ncbi:MAG: RluA family pseudouridine synthase [Deltaproteobacteria bacterium]|nr:RluA family pseudouridine synthase [Deltaproteobacteria bacterium]